RNHGKNLTACYEHRSVWLAERQAHYHKYMHQLPLHLTPDQISDIQDALQITASTHLNGPLSQKATAALAGFLYEYREVETEQRKKGTDLFLAIRR
ncbi:MAG TPA: hypothetical protein VIH17_11655, partial [Candidatus Acidoferrales bacterium]